MRTLEVEFGERAHIGIVNDFGCSEDRWQVEEIAARYGGSLRDFEGKTLIEDQIPHVPATSRDTIELRVIDGEGAEVEYIHPNRRSDSPPSVRKLNKPGDNYVVLVQDPTGNRNVVSKAFVVVK